MPQNKDIFPKTVSDFQ